jgi:hypothetical protein
MASWAKTDAVGSAPLWAATQFNQAPSTANRTSLYNGSVTNFITGVTLAMFNYDTTETQSGKIAHTGWVVTTAGSGGRTGRTQYETLVCLTSN